ncbi:MAG: hypothetical protein CMJ81_11365 [Planctomycetaceae bacterium]|nr:hypothetical protein [Planctomycetaceae bacterium]MBP60319.1 hypothetical protein [Planctomycetaceae bacterium]
MGHLKQILSWGPTGDSKPLVAAAFDTVAPVCDRMVVVVGHQSDKVLNALAPRCFVSVEGHPDGTMFDSLRVGLSEVQEMDTGANIVIQPGDHPFISPEVLEHLLEVAGRYPSHAVMPQYQGKGGHPVIVPSNLLESLLQWEGEDGLRGYWRMKPDVCRRVEVKDPFVIQDLDTPEDYENFH